MSIVFVVVMVIIALGLCLYYLPPSLNDTYTPKKGEFACDNETTYGVVLGCKRILDPTVQEPFISPEKTEQWFNDYHKARMAYLNDFIKADYIQSYPWMAAHPNELTTAAKPEIIGNLVYRPMDYYDYGEITYIGNSL